MDRPYLQDLWISNYGCIKDVHLTFSPLHALIGPNDSGKTTILRALQTLAALGDRRNADGILYRSMLKSTQRGEMALSMATSDQDRIVFQPGRLGLQVGQSTVKGKGYWDGRFTHNGAGVVQYRFRWNNPDNNSSWNNGHWNNGALYLATEVSSTLRNCSLIRLDPDALRTPRALLQEGAPIRFEDERGLGLPAVYDAIQNRDIQSFLDLNAEIKKLFPDVKSIRLKNPSAGTKSIAITLLDGTDIEAEQMSEGLLYYLAFAALQYIDQPAILLIEEPENGLHPARIAEVMRVLRELSKTTQVILATHSPLVINELEPHEVSVITRSREKGTEARLIKDTANFEERSKVYALGELWLSYANGVDEAPLISGGPRT